jgi:hypothetical protein
VDEFEDDEDELPPHHCDGDVALHDEDGTLAVGSDLNDDDDDVDDENGGDSASDDDNNDLVEVTGITNATAFCSVQPKTMQD